MALRPFKHTSAISPDEAAALLAKHRGKAVVIAGGTDLLGALKDKIHPTYPELLVDLKPIDGLRYVKEDKKGLRIGALTTLSQVATHQTIRAKYPLLAKAAQSVASPQIRNMATIGGNICQEPRCWYYRAPENFFHCLRKGGEKCNAFFGENRYHSIFGAAPEVTPPCATNCPVQNDIPSYMNAVRQGDLRQAAVMLLACNPMPAITGRVCPHYCEQNCQRSDFDESVSVRNVERFMGDYVLEHTSELYQAPKSVTRKRVAVVGAGPAGLAAAYFLRKAGHPVTVLDKMPEAGGMLSYSIPLYRLPQEIVRRQVQALEQMGVVFTPNVEVGRKGVTLKDLRKKYDALFLATGMWRQKKLEIDKEGLLTQGLQFLSDARSGEPVSVGRKVLVIGGGNVAVDVAISALRLGASEVTMACLESRDEMPAFPEEVEQALTEKVQILTSWGPLRVLGSGGVLKGMELVRCTSVFDTERRFRPTFDSTVTRTVEADQVLLAIGQSADLSYAGRSLKTGRGLITVDGETMATNLPGVFVGGDVTTGPASVAEAIAAGRKAAEAIHAYLTGGKAKAKPEDRPARRTGIEFNAVALTKTGRAKVTEVPPAQRKIAQEDRSTLGQRAVEEEAQRCADCGCVAVNASDIAPALVALGATIKTTKRTIGADEFFAVSQMKATALDADELVTEITIPAPKAGSRQSFLKFRIRNSIDFPIVSVASVVTLAGGKVKAASIALGAVAPLPLRAKGVESYLKGKRLDEATAAEAGTIVIQGVRPLAQNKFKAQIVRALLGKAILAENESAEPLLE